MEHDKPIHTEEICFWISPVVTNTKKFFNLLTQNKIPHSVECVDKDGIIEVNAFERDIEQITQLRNDCNTF
jgi:hypothetical protein